MRTLLIAVLFGLLLVPGARADAPDIDAASLSAPTSLADMVGESLKYDISFLWFHHLAEAKLSLTPEGRPHIYKAVLEARTRGVAAWLTRDRIQRYVSRMKLGPDGKFHSLVHESHIIKGTGKNRVDRFKKYVFDADHHQVREKLVQNGKIRKEKVFPMGKGEPNDLLTAFYNFRAGFFGKIVPGGHYVIPSFSHKGESDIIVDILPRDEWPHRDFFPSGGMLGKVSADKEEFGTGDGSIYVWFNKFDQPDMGVVEDVIGLGNVRGRLRY